MTPAPKQRQIAAENVVRRHCHLKMRLLLLLVESTAKHQNVMAIWNSLTVAIMRNAINENPTPMSCWEKFNIIIIMECLPFTKTPPANRLTFTFRPHC
jgi:hypothetical protein